MSNPTARARRPQLVPSCFRRARRALRAKHSALAPVLKQRVIRAPERAQHAVPPLAVVCVHIRYLARARNHTVNSSRPQPLEPSVNLHHAYTPATQLRPIPGRASKPHSSVATPPATLPTDVWSLTSCASGPRVRFYGCSKLKSPALINTLPGTTMHVSNGFRMLIASYSWALEPHAREHRCGVSENGQTHDHTDAMPGDRYRQSPPR